MQASTIATLLVHYDRSVQAGQIKDDLAQREALALLQKLADQLAPKPSTSKLVGWFTPTPVPIQGIYIWGNVGRGKSMLMELFFEHAPVTQKRRIHFHAFMQEIHARMHQFRSKGRDPVVTLIETIAKETRLLCFDELQATDVTDASLLYRLFSGITDAGVTIVSTSNHPPASLYTGGIQRERFAKFIALIEARMQVLALSSPHDYRHQQIQSLEQVYFSPLGNDADAFIAGILSRLSTNATPTQERLEIQGRTLTIQRYNDSIGYARFQELCATALGAADYLAIAKRFDTLILTDIPRLTPENRNEAKRFVTLIDVLYENKIMLICTAATAAEQLYEEGDGAFEFQRTVSRLAEMRSQRYLANEAV